MDKALAALFGLFAFFQYNDPDWYIWIPIYLVVTTVALAYDFGWRNKSLVLLVCILYTVGMLSYMPEVISWINNGTPTITGSMQAESPFIEFVREFFGLLICLITLVYFARKMKS